MIVVEGPDMITNYKSLYSFHATSLILCTLKQTKIMVTFVSVHIPSKYEASYYTLLLLFLTLKPPFKIHTLKVTTILYSLCTYFHSALFTLSLTLLKLHLRREIFSRIVRNAFQISKFAMDWRKI